MQKIQHRNDSLVEQTIMILNNMNESKYNEAKIRALAEVRQIASTGQGELDPNSTLASLPTTLEQYHEQLHGVTPTQQQPHFVRAMYDNNKKSAVGPPNQGRAQARYSALSFCLLGKK